jgi:hypothetical protein
MRKLLAGIAGLVILLLACAFLFSKSPAIKVEPAVKAIGINTPVNVEVDSPHGVRQVAAYLDQNGKRFKVLKRTSPRGGTPSFAALKPPAS